MNLSLRRVEAHAAGRRRELVRWADVAVDEPQRRAPAPGDGADVRRAARYGLDLTAWKRGRVWNIDHLGRPTCRSRP